MAFWAQNFGSETGLKDPKRQFRFMVEFQGIQATQGGAALWYAKTVTKPSFSIAAAEHKYLNHTFYYPGSVSWQDITVTLVDPVEPDVGATLADIITKSGYSPPTDANSLTTMSKSKAASGLGSVIITQFDAEGKPLETWTLWNSFITELKYGDLQYGEDSLTELSITLKYDWARLEVNSDGSAAKGAGGKEFFGV